MSVSTSCPSCQTDYTLADDKVGKKVRCKSCQDIFTVEANGKKASNGAKSGNGATDAPVTVACPHCDHTVRLRRAFLGERLRCKGCGQPFTAKAKEENVSAKVTAAAGVVKKTSLGKKTALVSKSAEVNGDDDGEDAAVSEKPIKKKAALPVKKKQVDDDEDQDDEPVEQEEAEEEEQFKKSDKKKDKKKEKAEDDDEDDDDDEGDGKKKKKKKKKKDKEEKQKPWLLIGVGGGALVAIAVVAFILLSGGSEEEPKTKPIAKTSGLSVGPSDPDIPIEEKDKTDEKDDPKDPVIQHLALLDRDLLNRREDVQRAAEFFAYTKLFEYRSDKVLKEKGDKHRDDITIEPFTRTDKADKPLDLIGDTKGGSVKKAHEREFNPAMLGSYGLKSVDFKRLTGFRQVDYRFPPHRRKREIAKGLELLIDHPEYKTFDASWAAWTRWVDKEDLSELKLHVTRAPKNTYRIMVMNALARIQTPEACVFLAYALEGPERSEAEKLLNWIGEVRAYNDALRRSDLVADALVKDHSELFFDKLRDAKVRAELKKLSELEKLKKKTGEEMTKIDANRLAELRKYEKTLEHIRSATEPVRKAVNPYVYHNQQAVREIAYELLFDYGVDTDVIPRLPRLKKDLDMTTVVAELKANTAEGSGDAPDDKLPFPERDNRLRVLAALGWLQKQALDPKQWEEVAKALNPMLVDRNDQFMRSNAVICIQRWAHKENISNLVAAFKEPLFSDEHELDLIALTKIPGKEGAAALIGMIMDLPPGLMAKEPLLSYFKALPDPESQKAMLPFFNHKDPAVREPARNNVLRAVGNKYMALEDVINQCAGDMSGEGGVAAMDWLAKPVPAPPFGARFPAAIEMKKRDEMIMTARGLADQKDATEPLQIALRGAASRMLTAWAAPPPKKTP